MEPSLSELQQKALFLPRSSLIDLQEIGQGNYIYSWHDGACHNPAMKICTGEYGKVYRGTYRAGGGKGTGVQIAIKTIKKYESSKEMENFLKEMNIMAKLLHPNIVRLFGLVQQGS